MELYNLVIVWFGVLCSCFAWNCTYFMVWSVVTFYVFWYCIIGDCMVCFIVFLCGLNYKILYGVVRYGVIF